MVIVGCVTLSTSVADLPATRKLVPDDRANSAFFKGCASGIFPGHIATCVCPGDGCHTNFCALRLPDVHTTQRPKIKRFITIPKSSRLTNCASSIFKQFMTLTHVQAYQDHVLGVLSAIRK